MISTCPSSDELRALNDRLPLDRGSRPVMSKRESGAKAAAAWMIPASFLLKRTNSRCLVAGESKRTLYHLPYQMPPGNHTDRGKKRPNSPLKSIDRAGAFNVVPDSALDVSSQGQASRVGSEHGPSSKPQPTRDTQPSSSFLLGKKLLSQSKPDEAFQSPLSTEPATGICWDFTTNREPGSSHVFALIRWARLAMWKLHCGAYGFLPGEGQVRGR